MLTTILAYSLVAVFSALAIAFGWETGKLMVTDKPGTGGQMIVGIIFSIGFLTLAYNLAQQFGI